LGNSSSERNAWRGQAHGGYGSAAAGWQRTPHPQPAAKAPPDRGAQPGGPGPRTLPGTLPQPPRSQRASQRQRLLPRFASFCCRSNVRTERCSQTRGDNGAASYRPGEGLQQRICRKAAEQPSKPRKCEIWFISLATSSEQN